MSIGAQGSPPEDHSHWGESISSSMAPRVPSMPLAAHHSNADKGRRGHATLGAQSGINTKKTEGAPGRRMSQGRPKAGRLLPEKQKADLQIYVQT